MPKQVQSHSCFRAVPDRTARARSWRRLKQNKQAKPSDTQDAYPDQNCFSRAEKGQVPTFGVGAAATAPAAGTVLLPLLFLFLLLLPPDLLLFSYPLLSFSPSSPSFFSASPTPPHIYPCLTLPHTRRAEGQGGIGPDLWP